MAKTELAADVDPAVAVHVTAAPEEPAVVQLVTTLPKVQLSVALEGVTKFRFHVTGFPTPAGKYDQIFMLGVQAAGTTTVLSEINAVLEILLTGL